MKNLTVKVISLKDAAARRLSISEQMDRLKIRYDYFDAVDLRFESENEVALYYIDKESFARPLTKAEVGCSLSHVRCYEEFLSGEFDFALIIEDDADLSGLSKEILSELMLNMVNSNADVILLGYSKVSPDKMNFVSMVEPIKKICSFGNYQLGEVWKNWTCGTVAYLISRKGANKLYGEYFLNNNSKVETVADDWGFFVKRFGLKILHIRPLLIFEKYISFESSIENERSKLNKARNKNLDWMRILRGYVRKLLLVLRGLRGIKF
jgi:glycosyl transferase family 25